VDLGSLESSAAGDVLQQGVFLRDAVAVFYPAPSVGEDASKRGGLTDDTSIDHDVKFRSRGSRGAGDRRLVCVA
jgi:hypothetical protein